MSPCSEGGLTLETHHDQSPSWALHHNISPTTCLGGEERNLVINERPVPGSERMAGCRRGRLEEGRKELELNVYWQRQPATGLTQPTDGSITNHYWCNISAAASYCLYHLGHHSLLQMYLGHFLHDCATSPLFLLSLMDGTKDRNSRWYQNTGRIFLHLFLLIFVVVCCVLQTVSISQNVNHRNFLLHRNLLSSLRLTHLSSCSTDCWFFIFLSFVRRSGAARSFFLSQT